MSKFLKDITGQRFGKLTVLYRSRTHKNRSAVWRCRCDCGNESDVRGQFLRDGTTQSCGCKGKRLDISGKKFGKLTALYVSGVSRSGNTIWRCRCSCDQKTEIDVDSRNLITGNVRSCKCIKRLDLSGKTFGKIRVIEYAGLNRRKSSLWKCECSCGLIKIIPGRDLVTGKVVSCGCYNREQSRIRHTIHGLSNTPEYKISSSNRRREKKAEYDSRWTSDMEIALRDMFPACVVCGSSNGMSTDHVRSLYSGNGLAPGNATRLCRKCNSKKGRSSPDELPKSTTADAGRKILESAELFKKKWATLHPEWAAYIGV